MVAVKARQAFTCTSQRERAVGNGSLRLVARGCPAQRCTSGPAVKRQRGRLSNGRLLRSDGELNVCPDVSGEEQKARLSECEMVISLKAVAC